jgi:hypothetical protein
MASTESCATGSDWKSGAVICSCLLIREEIDLKFFTGMVVAFGLCSKRLERGRYSWPHQADQSDQVTLSHEELSLLLGGIDLTRTRRKNWYRKTVFESEKV